MALPPSTTCARLTCRVAPRQTVASSSRRLPRFARSIITIPHPSLAGVPASQKHFLVRTAKPLPSLLHAYAVIRAVEQRLGPAISVEVVKDPDTLRPSNFIHLELLRPHELDKALELEVPPPAAKRSDHLGGPDMQDIQDVVRSAAVAAEAASGTEVPIQFIVDVRRSPPRTRRARSQRIAGNERLPHEVEEDERILKALEAFDGGFHGEFQGLAERFRHLRRPAEPALSTEGDEIEQTRASEATELDRIDGATAEYGVEIAPRILPSPVPTEAPAGAAASPAASPLSTPPPPPTAPLSLPQPKSRAERLRDQALESARQNIKLQAEAVSAAAAEREAAQEREAALLAEEANQSREQGASAAPRAAPPSGRSGGSEESKTNDTPGLFSWFTGKS